MSNSIALNREIINSRGLTAAIGVIFFVLATTFGAYIRIPIPGTPVPITLQTFFVALSGAVLGKRLGLISQTAYVMLGALGLPIFQGYGFGLMHALGSTGGYLMGFMAASFIVGRMLEKETTNLYKIVASFVTGNIVLYSLGVTWLMVIYRISFAGAVTIGLLPFLAAEAVKISAAVFVYNFIAGRSRKIFS